MGQDSIHGLRDFFLAQDGTRRLSACAAILMTLLLSTVECKAQSATAETSSPVILPANTPVILHLMKSLYKKDAKSGHPVEFEVGYDVVVNGQIIIQRGTAVIGSVRRVDHTGKGPAEVLIDLGPAETVSGEMVHLASTGATASDQSNIMGAVGYVDEPMALPIIVPVLVVMKVFEKKVLLDKDAGAGWFGMVHGVWVVAYVAENVALDPAKLKTTQTPTSEVLRGGLVILRLILAPGLPDMRMLSIVSTADRLHRGGDLNGAIEGYQQALALEPDSPELHWELAELFREKGDFARAVPESAAAARLLIARVQLYPNDERSRMDLISTLVDAGDLDRAVSEANEAIRMWPERPYFHYLLGRALVKKNEPDAAIVELQWVLKVERNHDWKASCELGRAYELKGDLKAALRQYRTAFQAHGGDKECHAAYERLRLQLKNGAAD